MNLKTVIALAIAAAFAAPVVAQTSPRTDTTGAPVTGGSNAADRPANTPKSDVGAPAAVPGANTSGSNAADRKPNTPKSETGAAGATTLGTFASLDRNGDGYISRDEARDAAWNSRFAELDKDNDGRLSRSEYDAMSASGGAAGTTARPVTPPAGSAPRSDTGSSSGITSGAGSSTTGGMGGSTGPAGTQSGSSTSGIGDKPGQKQ